MEGKVNKAFGHTDSDSEGATKTDLNGTLAHVQSEESQPDPFRKYRIGKQIVLVVIWICIGLAGEMSGPTLPDLKDRLGVNYEQAGQVLLGKSFGMLVGAVLGGYINERFNRHVDIIMAASLVLMATAAAATPFSKAVILTGAMFALNGFAEGVINTAGNAMVMHLFGENTASPMHSLHFGFGLGALIAPQVARPFLSDDALAEQEDDDDDVTTAVPMTTYPQNGTVAPWVDTSRIEIPYCIAAGVIFLFSFVLAGFYFKGPPKGFKLREPKTDFRSMISPKTCAHGNFSYGVQLLVCLFFYFIQAVGGERAYGKFLFSFAIESDIKMRKSEASLLQTAFWASFTVGRLLGVPLSQIFSVRTMIIGDIVGNIIVSIILSIFAHQEVLVLWICSCFIGLFISVVFPNGMSWANLKMQMSSVTVMLLMIGGSAGDFIYNYLTGYVFERDPRNLMYVMIGYTLILAVVYIIMEIIVRCNRGKVANEEDVADIKVVYSSENDSTYM